MARRRDIELVSEGLRSFGASRERRRRAEERETERESRRGEREETRKYREDVLGQRAEEFEKTQEEKKRERDFRMKQLEREIESRREREEAKRTPLQESQRKVAAFEKKYAIDPTQPIPAEPGQFGVPSPEQDREFKEYEYHKGVTDAALAKEAAKLKESRRRFEVTAAPEPKAPLTPLQEAQAKAELEKTKTGTRTAKLKANADANLAGQPYPYPDLAAESLSSIDRSAYQWAKSNPSDPRAARILSGLGF